MPTPKSPGTAPGSCAGWLRMLCGRGFAPRKSKLLSNARRAFLRPANLRPLNGLTPSRIIGVALPVTIASTIAANTAALPPIRCLFRHRTICFEHRAGPSPTGHFHFKDYDLTTEVKSCMSYSHADGALFCVPRRSYKYPTLERKTSEAAGRSAFS